MAEFSARLYTMGGDFYEIDIEALRVIIEAINQGDKIVWISKDEVHTGILVNNIAKLEWV